MTMILNRVTGHPAVEAEVRRRLLRHHLEVALALAIEPRHPAEPPLHPELEAYLRDALWALERGDAA